MKRSWWDFHTPGDKDCEACAVPPRAHEGITAHLGECAASPSGSATVGWADCGGLTHMQFNEELDETEAKCDRCNLLLPVPAVG